MDLKKHYKTMVPIVKTSASHIKDSQYALEIFRYFNFLSQNKHLFTMDIASLHIVIPNDESLRALKHFFDQRTVKEPSSGTLLHQTEPVLTLKTNGVAMRPGHAKSFRRFYRTPIFSQYNGPNGRHIDDCIGATSSTREELTQFITAVDSFHPALKYTWEISDTSLAILDIKISTEGNGLCTSVYYRPSDSHRYLFYSSSHPS